MGESPIRLDRIDFHLFADSVNSIYHEVGLDGQMRVDVIVVGGGASGVPAALQAARLGARVLLVEETPWLGGMLTSAGVSALDGNDAILSGIHREFVEALWEFHGGPESVRTGWVSNTMFEPSVGQEILRRFVDAEPNITLWLEARVAEILTEGPRVTGVRTTDGRSVRGVVVIDATEFGDVIAMAGAAHRVGRESRAQTGESVAPPEPDNLVQDSTYCLTVRDFDPGADRTVPAPPGYDPAAFAGSVREVTPDPGRFPFEVHSWESMISYGRLPNGRFMVNWPTQGNDFFAPELIELSPEERGALIQRMKNHALGFLRYLQTVCGHAELGLDEGAYPTPDGLPLIPYVRESRRIEATVMLHLDDVVDRHANPKRPLFKAGVAVGDYFIDHHHNSLLLSGEHRHLCDDKSFPPIQAVTVPLGCLIPMKVDGLLAAEKSIGVTHAVNGVTRLQPIVMNIGQAAGALAALASGQGLQPREVDVRDVQQTLLDAGALLMPFADVRPERWSFQAIHRVVVSGVMRGFDQIRRCEFRPEHAATLAEVHESLRSTCGRAGPSLDRLDSNQPRNLTRGELALAVHQLRGAPRETSETAALAELLSGEDVGQAAGFFHAEGLDRGWAEDGHSEPHATVKREELAVVIDRAFDPFRSLPLELPAGGSV